MGQNRKQVPLKRRKSGTLGEYETLTHRRYSYCEVFREEGALIKSHTKWGMKYDYTICAISAGN